ncbi:MAG: DUF11 domain-containing protein [Thiothrix sp.]|nr:DUF11 domain-containing protein [Thiothrix sp.]
MFLTLLPAATAKAATADLGVFKSDGSNAASSGSSITYTITVTNYGPNASTALLTDPAVSGLVINKIACGPVPGVCSSPPTVASLQAGFTTPSIPAGGTYQIKAAATVTATSGGITNTATVATPAGTTDPVSSNNSSTDTDSNLFDMISVCTGTALVKAGDFTSSPVASSTGWYMANSPFDTPISNVYNYTGTSAYRNSDMTGGLFDMVNPAPRNASTGILSALQESDGPGRAIVYAFGQPLVAGDYVFSADLSNRFKQNIFADQYKISLYNPVNDTVVTVIAQDYDDNIPAAYVESPGWANITRTFTVPATGSYYLLFQIDPNLAAQNSDYMIDRVAVAPIDNGSCPGEKDRSDLPADGLIAPNQASNTAYGEALHTIDTTIRLGSTNTSDANPIRSPAASTDTGDDGIILPAFTQGQSAIITASVTGAGGYLQGWIDWNGDGVFGSDEQVAANLQDNQSGDTDNTSGVIRFVVNVPATSLLNQTFARFRWSTAQGLDSTTTATNGEAEDYALTIQSGTYSVSGRVLDDRNVNAADDGEPGLADVTVVLHDTIGNTCRSTRTQADGTYRFRAVWPGSYRLYEAAGETVPAPRNCPPALTGDPSDYVSTTPNALGPFSVTAAAVTTMDFGDVHAPQFNLDNEKAGLPDQVMVHPHTFIAAADGQISFNVTALYPDPASLDWSTQVYLDTNCDAALDGGDRLYATAIAVNAGEQVCVLVKVLTPGAASSGAMLTSVIKSEFTYGNGSAGLADDIQQHTDISRVIAGPGTGASSGAGVLNLQKKVWNVTRNIDGKVTLAGETLRYTIAYTNIGAGTVNALVIHDQVPTFTQLVPTSMSCSDHPPELPPCNTASGPDGALEWRWNTGGMLPSGSGGSVSYEVVVE